jgi:hypothetical protein
MMVLGSTADSADRFSKLEFHRGNAHAASRPESDMESSESWEWESQTILPVASCSAAAAEADWP